MPAPLLYLAILAGAVAIRRARESSSAPTVESTPSTAAPTPTETPADHGRGTDDSTERELQRLRRQNERLKRRVAKGARARAAAPKGEPHAQDGNAGLDRGNRVPRGSAGQAGNDSVVLTDDAAPDAAPGVQPEPEQGEANE